MLPIWNRTEASTPHRRDLMRGALRWLGAVFVAVPGAAAAQPAAGRQGLPANGFTHISMCVSDLQRSLRFYCDGLGFEKISEPRPSNPGIGRLVGIDGDVKFWLQRLRRDGITLQLMKFDAPTAAGDGAVRPMNQLGVTHLSFRVADLDATLAAVRSNGGTVLDASLTVLATSRFVFCTDPDGMRVEISASANP
jgi:catechol 2,3-dioxygenase-like lactoylglutathione lyase family enzyme